MRNSPAGVVILGSGELALAHARVAVAHPDLHLRALVDADDDAAAAMALLVVHRFEGERPQIFAELDDALAACDADIVVIAGDGDDTAATVRALSSGAVVVGGPKAPAGEWAARWYPFEPARARPDDAEDSAFTEHLDLYESILEQAGVRA